MIAHLLAQTAMPMQQGPAPEPLPHPEIPPPVELTPPLEWWVYALIVLALFIVVALVLLMIYGRKSGPAVAAKQPLKEAMRALKELRNKADVLSPADIGHGVSEVLRQYYLDRYHIPAPFRTSEELFPNVNRNDEPLRRRIWRERFESLAALYDSLSYAPLPATRADAIQLVETAISKLEDERLNDSPLAA